MYVATVWCMGLVHPGARIKVMLPLLQASGLRQSYPATRELVVVVTEVHKSVPFSCDCLLGFGK